MTYAEACALLGYATPPLLSREDRRELVERVVGASEQGTRSIPPETAKELRDEYEPSHMTYEDACALLGFDHPPDLDAWSRDLVLRFVKVKSENGRCSIDPRLATLYRAEIEEFG